MAAANAPIWLSVPSGSIHVSDCPQGLECLQSIDQLMFNQVESHGESGCGTRSKYSIKNTLGQKVYVATVNADFCGQFYGLFEVRVADQADREVIHVSREANFCEQKLSVFSPPDEIIGTMHTSFSWREPFYSVHEADGNLACRIRGSCDCNGCSDLEFRLLGADNAAEPIGVIRNHWTGLREIFADGDNFGITFPKDLRVQTKAALIGAVLFIDFLYFEHDQS